MQSLIINANACYLTQVYQVYQIYKVIRKTLFMSAQLRTAVMIREAVNVVTVLSLFSQITFSIRR